MKFFFIVYGTGICLFFSYATYSGWTVVDSIKSGKWGPRGHNVYHK